MAPTSIGFLIRMAVIVLVALVIVRAVSRRKNADKADPAANRPVSPAFWLLVAALLATMLVLGGPPGFVPPGRLIWLLLPLPLLIAMALVGLVFWQNQKYRDRVADRAVRRADEGDVDGAIRELREAIELNGANATRWGTLGLLYMRQDAWGEAIAAHTEGLELEPDRFDLKNNLAMALMKGGRHHEAASLMDKLIAEGLKDPVLFNNHAHALARVGRVGEAEASLQEAIELLDKTKYLTLKDVKSDLRREFALTRAAIDEARGQKAAEGLDDL